MQMKAVFHYSAPCPLHLIKLINEVLMSYYRHYPTFVYYIFLALTTAHAVQLAGSLQLQHNMQK